MSYHGVPTWMPISYIIYILFISYHLLGFPASPWFDTYFKCENCHPLPREPPRPELREDVLDSAAPSGVPHPTLAVHPRRRGRAEDWDLRTESLRPLICRLCRYIHRYYIWILYTYIYIHIILLLFINIIYIYISYVYIIYIIYIYIKYPNKGPKMNRSNPWPGGEAILCCDDPWGRFSFNVSCFGLHVWSRYLSDDNYWDHQIVICSCSCVPRLYHFFADWLREHSPESMVLPPIITAFPLGVLLNNVELWKLFIIVTILIWVCLKIGYIPNYSHLVGIMIINHWV